MVDIFCLFFLVSPLAFARSNNDSLKVPLAFFQRAFCNFLAGLICLRVVQPWRYRGKSLVNKSLSKSGPARFPGCKVDLTKPS
jgi:hypothetical protein